jgi:polysaccharide biosynthesis protein VpsM
MKSFTKLSIAFVPILGALATTQAAISLGEDASLFVSANAGFRSESNVLLTHDGETSDTAYLFTPGVELVLGKKDVSDLSANVAYRYHVISYADDSDLDAYNNDVAAYLNYNAPSLDVKGLFSYVEAQTNTQLWDNSISDYEPGTVDRNILNASGYAEIEFGPKTKVGIGTAYMNQRYELDTYTDYSSISIPMDVYYSISPKLDLSVDGSYRTISVGDRNSRDVTDTSLMAGIRGSITPKITGFLRAGYVSRDAGDSGLSETSGLSMSGDLAYQINPKASMSLGLLRDLSISPVSGNTTERTGGSLRGLYSLTDTISLNARVIYYTTDYQDSSRSDDYTVYGLGASYQPNKYVSFAANYDWASNDSDAVAADYSNDVLQVSVTIRY